MKKIVTILTIVALCATLLVACGKKEETNTNTNTNTTTTAPVENTTTTAPAETPTEHAEYTIYNTTGATVTDLYIYDAGSSDKGENLAGAGMADGASLVVTRDATKEVADAAVYIVEFKAEGMDTQSFDTLHFEVAPIYLLSVDAASGATAISFREPKEHAEYTVTNSTGVTVTELYLYDAGSSDKGENLAGAGMAAGDVIVLTRDEVKAVADAAVYVLEFVAEGMGTQSFDTLHFEVAPIYLLSVDAASGATAISFREPKKHAEYTVYNTTGVTVTELYLYDAGSEDKGENLAGAGMAAGDVIVITRDETQEVADAAVYVLEFVAEGMEAQSFDTLHFEVAPISLLSVDAASGATAVKFKEPKEHAEYTVYNTTGVTVTELYLYDAGSEDKGENLAGAGMAAGDVIVITRDEVKAVAEAAVYVLEFTAEGMETQSFDTLHFEVAPISLLSVDAASGATAVKFKQPE